MLTLLGGLAEFDASYSRPDGRGPQAD